MPDDFNRVNPDLLRLMPVDARVVLEVGCGAGALAGAYRRINPDVRYLGIEKEAEAARTAESAGRLDRVVLGDVEAIELSALGLSEPVVDCLVFGDVLEHMIDPLGVLTRLARGVRPGGQVLARIPNVQHYSVLVNLLRGRWEYQRDGPLDRTHPRFFTLSGIQELFARSGLHVFEVVPRWRPSPEFDEFQKLMAPVVRALGIDASTFAVQTRSVQYIVRSIRSGDEPRRMLIWSLLGSTIASEVRVGEPGAFLGTIPGVRILAGTGLQFDDLDRTIRGEERVFLQQRVIISRAEHLRLQRALLEKGYLIVCEFDDDPAHFAELGRGDFLALRGCHRIQTSTERMAESLRPYNPHVRVFPNHVASLPPPRSSDQPDSGPVTIFFGALNRETDWAPILPVLNGVLAAHGAGVRVQVVYDRLFFEALATEYKAFEPLCAYERYQALLAQADIALMPLEPTPFNRHKSDLKFIESAAQGAAVLASPTVYEQTIRDGETGLIYHSLDEFAEYLDRLIRDRPFRRRLAGTGYRHVAGNRLLARHIRDRYDWYRAMLARRDQLDAELRRRVPELSGP